MTTHPQRRRRWIFTRDDLQMAVIAITPTVVVALFCGLVFLNGGR